MGGFYIFEFPVLKSYKQQNLVPNKAFFLYLDKAQMVVSLRAVLILCGLFKLKSFFGVTKEVSHREKLGNKKSPCDPPGTPLEGLDPQIGNPWCSSLCAWDAEGCSLVTCKYNKHYAAMKLSSPKDSSVLSRASDALCTKTREQSPKAPDL